MPHMLQCSLLLLRSVSQPLVNDPSQFPQPELQVSRRHIPVEHVAMALAREQVVRHPPQLERVLRRVSQPLG